MKQRVERLLLRGPLILAQSWNSTTTRLRRTVGLPAQPHLYFMVPQANWTIDEIGKAVTSEIRTQFGVPAHLTFNATGIRDQILHYGALGSFTSSLSQPWNDYNHVVTTIFHGDRTGDEPQLVEQVEALIANADVPATIVTACTLMVDRLLSWGIPSYKVVKIPIGIDLTRFTPVPPTQRQILRQRLGIPENAICIGSFQKDGVGWGAGNEPKLIKGPDLFLEVIAQLHTQYPLFVLLTGPARGFVTKGLDALGVPYRHDLLDNFLDIVDYYRCLDLYIVTAREEGGPQAVLESLATGVPLVSTRVGLAPDLIQTGTNGLLTAVEDVTGLVAAAQQMLEDPALRQQYVHNGLQTIQAYGWPQIAQCYWTEVYAPLMAQGQIRRGMPDEQR